MQDRSGIFEFKNRRYKVNPALVLGVYLEPILQESQSIVSEKAKEMHQSLYYEYFMNQTKSELDDQDEEEKLQLDIVAEDSESLVGNVNNVECNIREDLSITKEFLEGEEFKDGEMTSRN